MSTHPSFQETAAFHGHVCPGLAIGYRMTCAAMDRLTAARAQDEHMVAVVENDACGVDAVQYLSGCTFGKGNLVFRDYGRHVYTFFHRASGQAVRVRAVDHPDAPRDREARIQWLLTAPEQDVVATEPVQAEAPERARIHASGVCAYCGERVMETRLGLRDGKPCCIPCAEAATAARP